MNEGHFFKEGLVNVAEALADEGRRVIVAGLNQDFRGCSFETMKELLVLADKITLLTAICVICGSEATRTQRLVKGRPAHYDGPRILVGGEEKYQARCRACHEVPGRPEARSVV